MKERTDMTVSSSSDTLFLYLPPEIYLNNLEWSLELKPKGDAPGRVL